MKALMIGNRNLRQFLVACIFICFNCNPVLAIRPQAADLKAINHEITDAGFSLRIQLSGAARFATLFQAEPPAVLIFLHEVQLNHFDDSALAAHAQLRSIKVEQWSQRPHIVRITVPVSKNVAYSAISRGAEIILNVGRKNGFNTRPEPSEFPPSIPRQSPHDGTGEDRSPIFSQRSRLKRLTGTDPISLDLHDAEIGNVLRLLAKQNALNIIASDSVAGTVTLTLQNVSVEQALESLLRAKGYRYLIDGDIIVVKSEKEFGITDLETRVYRLRHVDANNVLDAITEIKSPAGKIKVLTPSFNNRADVYEINKRRSTREEQYWQRSSVLLVTDLPSHLEAIDKLIAALDVPVSQVMIEARLIELTPQEKSGLGIEWDRELKAELYDIDLSKSSSYDYAAQARRKMSFNLATLNARQFKVVLKYLQEHTNSRLLSNPRILTMDNEPSDISVGTTFPIPSITRGVAGQGDLVTFTYKDVNITLRVIPHVTEDSTVTMYVNPIIEEVTGEVTIDQNTAPITVKRKVDTIVKVRSGNTIVIGGLIREKEAETLKRVWLLGEIPLLGHLFRSKDKEKVQTDLVIFLTPVIVE